MEGGRLAEEELRRYDVFGKRGAGCPSTVSLPSPSPPRFVVRVEEYDVSPPAGWVGFVSNYCCMGHWLLKID